MKKLGILGGGQLGKMLLPECMKLDIPTHVLDPDPHCSCAAWVGGRFQCGDFRDFETVYWFGKQVDVLTIEIEQVNVNALQKLADEGVEVHPAPAALRTIQDKGLQKLFYEKHGIATMPFRLFENTAQIWEAVENAEISLPFVQKSREMGYDGKGVLVVRTGEDLHKLLEGPSLVEQMADIDKELSVIVAQDAHSVRAFPAVEMVFHPTANLVEFLQCPASISPELEREAEALAIKTLKAFDMHGVLAVEMFLDKQGKLWVNEVAPRPHNSGHHTIETSYVSQYEQHLRSIMGLPLGDPSAKCAGVMLNVLGSPGHSGTAVYEGIEECFAIDGTSLHLYGKLETRPFRKMGHITIAAPTVEAAIEKSRKVKIEAKT